MALIWWLIVGLIAGGLGRLFIPGKQPMGLVMTMVLGLVGSILGGLVSMALFGAGDDGFRVGGIIMSTIGAVIVLGVYVGYLQSEARA